MAHFAELDSNNKVLRVVVISNEDLKDNNGEEQEDIGIQVCKNIFGADTNWIQTSYSSKFRKCYAGIGSTYDPVLDIFIPVQPAPWFVLTENHDWICPEHLNPATGEPYTESELLLNRIPKPDYSGVDED